MKSKVTIIHPIDPLGSRVGGIGTFLRGFIKYAPVDIEIDFLGITSDKMDRPVGEWRVLNIGNRSFKFLPVLYEKDENKKTIIPLSLRFTWKLMAGNYIADRSVLFFNRLEPVLAWRKSKLPKIIIIHSDIQQGLKKGMGESSWGKLPFMYFTLERYLIRLFNKVYSVSRGSVDYYINQYPGIKDRISFLPTYVDTDVFRLIDVSKKEIREKIILGYPELPLAEPWILFAGRIQKQKDPIRLVDSFREYYKKTGIGYLLIVGEGNLREELECHVDKVGLKTRVKFLGRMDPQEIVSIYRASDVFLLTSNFEGMPISVLEALACGLPVVTTNVGEVGKVVENGISGEIVESFEPGDIAKALWKVLNLPEVYSSDSCTKCITNYTPNKVLAQLFSGIESLMR